MAIELTYGSVCSGIEAATVAWHSLGFKPAWFSEIEAFPAKVLAHHYPTVPNLGDMCKLNEHEYYRNTRIDLLVGGTPCQSFSIAGLRGGLDDERGNLALEFCRILIAKQPRWFVWENVPGVFSSNDGKDFACILSAFTGQEVSAEGLGNAGCIGGADGGYSVAWRVLDAQYFGVPQRRRRVFVVGHIGADWRPPFALLFERDSLRRDFTPRREAGQGTAGKTKGGVEATGANDYLGDTLTKCANQTTGFIGEVVAGEVNCTPEGIAATVSKKWAKSSGGPSGDEHYNLVVEAFGIDQQRNGYYENSGCLQSKNEGGHCHAVVTFNWQNGDKHNMPIDVEKAATLDKSKTPAVVYDTTQITSTTNRSNPKEELCHTLNKGSDAPLLTYAIQTSQVNANSSNVSEETQFTLNKNDKPAAATSIARRLTPLECERLQGFPDNYTNIPGAKDTPRYAALGNSMAVPVMHWIGKRIKMFETITQP